MKNKGNFYLYIICVIPAPILFNRTLYALFCSEVIYTKGIPLDGVRRIFFLLLSLLCILGWLIKAIEIAIENEYLKNYKDFLKKLIASPFLYVWILTILISTGVLSVSKNFVIFAHIILIITEIIFIHTNYKNKET